MDRNEALRLLKGGSEGVAEWNRRRKAGEEIPPLREADLRGAHLIRADLRGAHLGKADLGRAALGGADLDRARCRRTNFADVDLSEIQGLESIHHDGPSTVGIDTLFRSQGKIPEAFLRGCGVPEVLITHLPSLIGAMSPIQFSSYFLSYSTKDEAFAQRLHARLCDEGLRVWFAPEDVQGGKKLHEPSDEAIRVSDKLLLVLSPNSLNSGWVKTEIRKARKIAIQEGQRKLFPIGLVDFETLRDWECFDADSGKDLGVEVREYFIPGFSQWTDHDAFEKSFARLLKDLKAEGSTAQ
jgi:TIR domain/Pentapeptide repeats (8 copies)